MAMEHQILQLDHQDPRPHQVKLQLGPVGDAPQLLCILREGSSAVSAQIFVRVFAPPMADKSHQGLHLRPCEPGADPMSGELAVLPPRIVQARGRNVVQGRLEGMPPLGSPCCPICGEAADERRDYYGEARGACHDR